MAKAAKYTEQMPFVGTKTQKDLLLAASGGARDSQAVVARTALNLLFGLEDGELPEGAVWDDAVARGTDAIRNPGRYRMVRVEEDVPVV